MKFDQFTIKSQEAIQQAFTIAQGYQHQAIENGHLLKGILSQGENLSNFLLKKLNVNPVNFEKVLDKIVESYPKVSGGEPYLSKEANQSLQKAMNISKEMGDQFVSVEHILLGILPSQWAKQYAKISHTYGMIILLVLIFTGFIGKVLFPIVFYIFRIFV